MQKSPDADTEVQAPESEVEILRLLLPTPIGNFGIELQDRLAIRVVIAPRGREKKLFKHYSELPDSEFLDEAFGHLSEYFAGARPSPEIDVDLGPSGVEGFQRRVLKEVCKIPYGKTRTYRKIALAAGKPNAYRMVLSTLLNNPIPILVPCHRVTTHKSGIGSYIGGARRKKWLLKMEKEGSQE